MILDFEQILKKYDIKLNNVIHVGANLCEEHDLYIKNGVNKVIYFEPNPETYSIIKNKFYKNENVVIHNCALGNNNKIVDFNISSNNASSSILKPKIHLTLHPNITFNKKIKVELNKLDDFNIDSSYNFLNMDVQGFELEVLKGGINTLKHIKYIMTEVNNDETYENNGLINDVEKLLSEFGFERKELYWARSTWGDAFYIKK
jgi:FkbM family methyltransferase